MEPLALVDIYQYNISHTVGVQLAAKTHIMLQSHMFKQVGDSGMTKPTN